MAGECKIAQGMVVEADKSAEQGKTVFEQSVAEHCEASCMGVESKEAEEQVCMSGECKAAASLARYRPVEDNSAGAEWYISEELGSHIVASCRAVG